LGCVVDQYVQRFLGYSVSEFNHSLWVAQVDAYHVETVNPVLMIRDCSEASDGIFWETRRDSEIGAIA
jgi:hypothetical protein